MLDRKGKVFPQKKKGSLKWCVLSFLLGGILGGTSVQGSSLEKMFERLGGDSNVTSPGGFQDQAAGYYTGGSVMLRQKSKAVSPINITLPHVGAGCGGLDVTFGSFSFVKGQELVELLRRMGAAVPTYAFQLALKTMAPQVETLMSGLRKIVQDMNALMLNDCGFVQSAMGGLWPKGTAASEMICQGATRSNNTDWFGARKHCQEEASVQRKVEETRTKYPDLLQGEYNLTWHVLQKMPEYKDNPEFCHFILTTVGTVISRKEGNRFRIEPFEGKGDQQDYLRAYLKGGETSLYTCDTAQKCLNPKEKTIRISEDTTLSAKTSKMIQALWTKYNEGSVLTEADKTFLSDASQLPLYKYIQISSAVGTPFIMNDTSDYIAITLLLAQFERIAAEVIAALDSLETIQLESSVIEKFKERLQILRGRLHTLQSKSDAMSIWRLNQVIQSYEQVLAARYHG